MKYSNKDYKKLGDRIRSNPKDIAIEDYDMLQDLRISYKSSLSTVFNSLETLAHKVDSDCICTYRIKRIESIVSKLIRFPEMQINRAEDIAGCRCILSSEELVYKLYNRILKNQAQLPFEIKGEPNDYIQHPKESGYKSIHINVSLKDENKRIEIQLRCLEHHNWATLVEITDLLYGLRLKEYGVKSNDELFKLHNLLSKSLDSMSVKERNYIADTIIKYKYIEKLGDVFAKNYIDVRKQWNSMKLQRCNFFLISTGQDGKPEFLGFHDFKDAESEYFEKFINNKSNKNIILTHLKNKEFAKISVAYSNYFLTFNYTMVKILHCLSLSVKETYKKHQIIKFSRYYKAFLNIMLFWMDRQIIEMNSFKNDADIKKSVNKFKEWEYTIKYCVGNFNMMFRQTHESLKFRLFNIIVYTTYKIKYHRFKKLAKEKINQQNNQ